MVDEKPPPAEEPSASTEVAAEPPANATDAGVQATAAEFDPPPAPTPHEEDPPVAGEQERWLRERFEREHEFTLSLMRLLLEGLTSESRRKRFWRWLIDDYRSERRVTADLGQPPNHERQLLHRVLAWLRSQRLVTRDQ